MSKAKNTSLYPITNPLLIGQTRIVSDQAQTHAVILQVSNEPSNPAIAKTLYCLTLPQTLPSTYPSTLHLLDSQGKLAWASAADTSNNDNRVLKSSQLLDLSRQMSVEIDIDTPPDPNSLFYVDDVSFVCKRRATRSEITTFVNVGDDRGGDSIFSNISLSGQLQMNDRRRILGPRDGLAVKGSKLVISTRGTPGAGAVSVCIRGIFL